MLRSRINQIIRDADELIRSHGFTLPPFGAWSDADVRAAGPQSHIVARRLGWDVTDYGSGRFDEMGLALFTLRNGTLKDLRAGQGMCYAEKLLISRHDQLSPMHTHVVKAEDIINRGGAILAVELFGSTPDGEFAPDAGGTVLCDGVEHTFTPGEVLQLAPGQSVTLRPGDWHAFWGDGGDVLVGEVSTVNDDETDNIFRDPIGRFAQVEEDEPAYRPLVSDYDRLCGA
ncbi:hypothetical protein SAMN04488020_110168 [Palleronia marisminoris]|uniref:D-lyxose ketol-isomerase n=1 Tax=Palleronia marisminoris TaxID=315423 RepID=A0A1Y5TA39_9RHOB|nr:D-lyxose/D-mannose family sugar isomerase [Palleronia marisminoris]SFH35262.1 hypothetical protein SAMN04488020_110168 [Palleronia marisminoris]SLN59349.1 hypothetical protein PAM7066_02910 [Palleronia marisminoris]